jgi:hypothetical protein
VRHALIEIVEGPAVVDVRVVAIEVEGLVGARVAGS